MKQLSFKLIWNRCVYLYLYISRRVLRDATYDPGHWTFYFCRRGFGLVVGVVVPLMLVVLPYARGRGFESQSRLYMCEPIYVSLRLFHCTLYKQLVFDHTLMRKGSVGRSCRAIGSKILSCGVVHRGFLAGYWGALRTTLVIEPSIFVEGGLV
jgi:hypothetical protein